MGNIFSGELEGMLSSGNGGDEAQEDLVGVNELFVEGCDTYMVFLL